MHNRIGWPDTTYKCRKIAAQFAQIAHSYKMPNVCGCLDGTLIEIVAPKNSGGVYVSRYGRTALNVLGNILCFYLVIIKF
jgi:hypothetical protein